MNFSSFLILCLLSHTLTFQIYENGFETMKQFERMSPAEKQFRTRISLLNQQTINLHNSQPDISFTMKAYSWQIYLTPEEFEQKYLSILDTNVPQSFQLPKDKLSQLKANPTSVDWAALGKTTIPKNQGICGSCYSFGVNAEIQSTYLIARGLVLDLSEQQAVDCSSPYQNLGCDGGSPYYTYSFILNYPLMIETDYPYKSGATGRIGTCVYTTSKQRYRIANAYYVQGASNLVTVLQSKTLSVYVAVDNNFQYYRSGILNSCGTTLNHLVQLVGVKIGSNYKIKNSWGTGWGEGGYMRISSTLMGGNLCGIATYGFFSTL